MLYNLQIHGHPVPTDTRNALEAAEFRLTELGWSVGDLAFWHHGRQTRQVFAHRQRRKIVNANA